MNEDVMIKLPTESVEEEFAAASSPTVSGIDQHKEMDSEPPKASISELHLNPSSSASSTSDSSSSDSDSESSSTLDSSDEKKEKIEDSKKIAVKHTHTKVLFSIFNLKILISSSIGKCARK